MKFFYLYCQWGLGRNSTKEERLFAGLRQFTWQNPLKLVIVAALQCTKDILVGIAKSGWSERPKREQTKLTLWSNARGSLPGLVDLNYFKTQMDKSLVVMQADMESSSFAPFAYVCTETWQSLISFEYVSTLSGCAGNYWHKLLVTSSLDSVLAQNTRSPVSRQNV